MSKNDQLLSERREKILNRLSEFRKDHPYPIITVSELSALADYITNNIPGISSVSYDKIVTFLLKNKLIKDAKIKDYNLFKYDDSQIDSFDIAHSFFRKTHFSYHTALFINGLTLQIPKTIYLDYERPKFYPVINKLIQTNIDEAFSKPSRVSSNITEIPHYNVLYVQSKNSNRLGIIPYRDIYLVTDLERTLIDVTVRPFYAGGVVEVLSAYEKAKGKLDVFKLYQYYKLMDFTYPYHQAIGFYMQKAGYKEVEYKVFKAFDMEFDFYLTYNMLHKNYSNEWKLYYPKGL